MASEGEHKDDKAASNDNQGVGVPDAPDQPKNESVEGGTAEEAKNVDDHDKTSDVDHQGGKKEDAPGLVEVTTRSEEEPGSKEKIPEDASGSGGWTEASGIVKNDDKQQEDHADDQKSTNTAKEEANTEEAKVVGGDASGTVPAGEQGEAKVDDGDGKAEAAASSEDTNAGAKSIADGKVDHNTENVATAEVVDGSETVTTATVPKDGEENPTSAHQQGADIEQPEGAVPGLEISVVEANKSAADKDSVRPLTAHSTHSENEDSFVENEEEMDMNVDKPWVKPCLEDAVAARKRVIWNQGMRSYCGTSIKEIGSMGVGMYLYFWIMRIAGIVFLFCALLSLPALVLNHEGNDGMSISETDMDSLGLVSLSYGHQGLNPELVIESGCIRSNGTVDCTGETVQVFGEAEDALRVGYILVGGEIIIAVFFAIFIMILSDRLEAKIDEIDESNVTPADYSVMVRGLPRDVTTEEVRRHFSDRYSLVEPGPSYPFLGVSTAGVGVFWASTLGAVFGVLAAPSVVTPLAMEGVQAAGVGLITVLVCMMGVYAVVEGCGVGTPKRRESPKQEWMRLRSMRMRKGGKKDKNKRETQAKYAPSAGTVVPVELPEANNDPVTLPIDGGVDGAIGNSGVAALEGDAAPVSWGEPGALEAGQGGGAGGVQEEAPVAVALQEEEVDWTLAEGRHPDPLPCQNSLRAHDKSFVGSWVADVVLGNPVGEVLRRFMEQEANLVKMRKAVTVVRQMKTLGDAKKLEKAEKKLEKLKKKQEAVLAATRKKRDPAELDKISVAFVTFEHEESKRRCLEDYRYSRRGFCRRFQPAKLQFCRLPQETPATAGENKQPPDNKRRGSKRKPLSKKWRLKVFQAPEPGDVKWENLDIPPLERKLRRAFTSLVCVILLIVSFAIIYLAQTEQAKLQEQIPALDTCEEAIPAVHFGTYDFPVLASLQRDESLDDTCEGDSFYLAYTANSSDPNAGLLDYTNLPDIYTAGGVNVSRDTFEAANTAGNLCDDPCQPTSGGVTCSALVCLEDSWEDEGYDCVKYSQSTMVGCYCLDVIVASIKENGLIDGIKEVASDHGDVCASFLKGYAKANAIKTLAILSVVIVNTLLTTVMAKLAKFERHVSLSDYISTVTAKLALAQFLNTALIVIIVNSGYTGNGLGFLKDMGLFGGDYSDFERSWYATVGVAVAMTMLLNVVVPHVKPLVSELIVKPIKRLLKRRSAPTQTELNNLYKPPPFDMESRYAFLLQVVGVSMLYSGGIPILYLFAAFSFAITFCVDKLWIIKLTKQPPMYTAALARMFVGVLPMALLMHMAVTCYMLGNVEILNVGFVTEEAQAVAEALQGEGISGLVAEHVLRQHVFPLFLLTILFFGLYFSYRIVGDPLLKLVKLILGTMWRAVCGDMCKRKKKESIPSYFLKPGFTAEFFRVLRKREKLDGAEKKMGWVTDEDGERARWLFVDDTPGPRGIKAKKGVPRQTWQAIAELGQYNYLMEESDVAGTATRYMATAGFLSPRMKEKEKFQREKVEKAAMKQDARIVQLQGPTDADQQQIDGVVVATAETAAELGDAKPPSGGTFISVKPSVSENEHAGDTDNSTPPPPETAAKNLAVVKENEIAVPTSDETPVETAPTAGATPAETEQLTGTEQPTGTAQPSGTDPTAAERQPADSAC